MKTIFPSEILDFSLEMHRSRNLKKRKTVYVLLLLFLFCVLISLPFIRIDVYKTSQGIIRPDKEKNNITSPIYGKIEKVFISDFSTVKKGDTLLKFNDATVSKELKLAEQQLEITEKYLDDLNYLCRTAHYSLDSLSSGIYQRQLLQHMGRVKLLGNELKFKQRHFERQKHLFSKGVIAKTTFENASFEFEKIKNELHLAMDRQKSLWQKELEQKNETLHHWISKSASLELSKSLHYIVSPANGDIQNLKGLEKNNYLYKGSSIAEISPQTDLLVECYVSPSDMVLIKKEGEVKFRIDAFRHKAKSTVSGNILHIDRDIISFNGNPAQKVLCSIEEPDTGFNTMNHQKIQKGMTLSAWFFIENRSLLQLIFDKLDDWYNPNLS